MANILMIRAGEGGRLAEEFAEGYVGVGWTRLGDMSAVTSQEKIRKHYLEVYPDEKPGAVANQIAMFNKFRFEVQVDDNVVSYDPRKREYLVGSIISDYKYQPNTVGNYPHIRKVRWDADGGISNIEDSQVLELRPLNQLGTRAQIIRNIFGGKENYWKAIHELEQELYLQA